MANYWKGIMRANSTPKLTSLSDMRWRALCGWRDCSRICASIGRLTSIGLSILLPWNATPSARTHYRFCRAPSREVVQKISHDPLPFVMAEETPFTLLFQNLIGNAIKYHRNGQPPHVHVSARKGAQDLR